MKKTQLQDIIRQEVNEQLLKEDKNEYLKDLKIK